MLHFDLCVIGSGPGGQKAAIQASKLGRKVCVIERMESVGGVAIHTGTIPSKALREAVVQATGGMDPLSARGDVSLGRITLESIISSCQRIIATEIAIVKTQLERNGVRVISGSGKFVGPNRVTIQGTTSRVTLTADKFILAVGTVPAKPASIPFDGRRIITSDDLLAMTKMPRSMIVIGGGVIGTEFASIFAKLGVRVTIVERADRILSFLDAQIGEALQYHLRDIGMTMRLGEELKKACVITEDQKGSKGRKRMLVEATLSSGKSIHGDILLYCLGRQGATGDLNLAEVDLMADARGRLKVNADYQTENPNVYAVGDVIGFPSLASTSMDQGRVAACRMFGGPAVSSPQLFPYGIYSIPEISLVGKNEEQLTTKGIPFESGMARYREIARGQLIGDHVGLLKLLIHQQTHEILGVHTFGTGATELIHIGQAVMALGGTVEYFVNTAFNYPTLAECYKVAALDGLNKLQR